MAYIILLVPVILLVVLFVNAVNRSGSLYGSDHYLHIRIIKLIKNNGHKFIKNYTHLVNVHPYQGPQLYHLILSYFNIDNPVRVNFIYKCTIYILDVLFFLFFFYSDFLSFNSKFPSFQIFLYAALLLIFTPFNYVRWNSSNAGLSARGFGVLLGRVFVYLFLFYIANPAYGYLIALVFTAYLIFIASQFAAQYMILLCFIYAAFSFNAIIAVIPFAGFALFYFLHPVIAVNYIKGQYQHKKIYATHLARQVLLKYRPGIWRDFFYDFWVKIKKDGIKALPYIQNNAVVTLIWGFTVLPILLYYLAHATFWHGQNDLVEFVKHSPLFQVVLITLLIFVLTSFRFTRFLGEPERYMEFANPAMAFLLIQTCSNEIIYCTIAYYVVASFAQILISKLYDKKSSSLKNNMLLALNEKQANGKSMTDILHELKEKHKTIRLFSNNEEIMRRLSSEDFLFLVPDISAEKTGSFFYKNIYNEAHPKVNEALLVPMIDEFDINVFIADTRYLSMPYTELLRPFNIETCFTLNYFVVVYINRKESA